MSEEIRYFVVGVFLGANVMGFILCTFIYKRLSIAPRKWRNAFFERREKA